MTPAPTRLVGHLADKVRCAGIVLDRTGLIPCGGGADNLVFAARTIEGRHLIVKAPLREGSRYATAAWAAKALAGRGVPTPQAIWHDAWVCVETRCPGVPFTVTADRLDTSDCAPAATVLRAAGEAGALLRVAHSIPVGGYGRLTPAGIGPHRSFLESLQPETTGPLRPDPTGGLASAARQIVADNLWRLSDPGPRLLLGDCAARHIFLDPGSGTVSGFIDLESARGGHPLADIAGFSVREHPRVTQALLDGYFPDGASIDETWALTLHRARIATFLVLFHTSRREHQVARRLANGLTADLAAITAESPTVLPAHLR